MESMEKRVDSLEKEVSSLRQQVQALETLDEKMQRLDERTLETKAICEAVRHGQEALIAKYNALALDAHNMQGNITHLTNILKEKVLPALTDHESSIQVVTCSRHLR